MATEPERTLLVRPGESSGPVAALDSVTVSRLLRSVGCNFRLRGPGNRPAVRRPGGRSVSEELDSRRITFVPSAAVFHWIWWALGHTLGWGPRMEYLYFVMMIVPATRSLSSSQCWKEGVRADRRPVADGLEGGDRRTGGSGQCVAARGNRF